MTASAWSVALIGMDGALVEVEAAIGGGLPRIVLVGLPDTALYEARDRCRAAVKGAELSWPDQLVTINLTPAALPKAGSHYDLAIASAVLAASGAVPPDLLRDTVMMGELGLDGRVRAVRGVLPGLLAAVDAGMVRAIVPASQLDEAALVPGIAIWGVSTLTDLVEVLRGRPVLNTVPAAADDPEPSKVPDLGDVTGQEAAKFALEVAAAGRHHLYLHGPPGVGKSMLASRLPGILPDLSPGEALEVSAVHSIAGQLHGGLIQRPTFADPLHNVSLTALVGGGQRVVRPGLVSLAHRGVLFLDEVLEFSSHLLEALRTPLESGWVTIARAQMMARFPARFQLVVAANPCPCGQFGTPGGQCSCSPMAVRRYAERLSGPILDRIDIQYRLLPVRTSSFGSAPTGESSAAVADRVQLARERQAWRLEGTGFTTNGEVPGSLLRHVLPAPLDTRPLDHALTRGLLSARGVDKVARVSWTLADLAGKDRVSASHLRQALAMRQGEQAEVAA
ncbi:YifB family Mg chelatase-like AAA ATPase [Aestuariimicrobium ganziense]|uniref:YifB family Mg chelatase-like AAA ATPase n=1 Tax=Aestuariimicrobium ganziense TaxID=2773677 RepID=UPI0019413A58|nr:YifB family Mg chelatase-like AAA ATPase [Aestuariimicrobium ganziense]